MRDSYIFKPRMRVLVDLLLGMNVIFLFAAMFQIVSAKGILFIALTANVLAVLIWFFWVRPTFTITISKGNISGPSKILSRISFSMRKIDHHKILLRTAKQKIVGYRKIWCLEGQYIRLFHRLLGKLAVFEIMEIVEKYPFRESVVKKDI